MWTNLVYNNFSFLVLNLIIRNLACENTLLKIEMKRQSESAKTDKAEMQATIDDLQKTLEVYEKQKPQVTNAS